MLISLPIIRRGNKSVTKFWWDPGAMRGALIEDYALRYASYSVLSATIGFTRVARRAGTKQERAATRVSRPATTR